MEDARYQAPHCWEQDFTKEQEEEAVQSTQSQVRTHTQPNARRDSYIQKHLEIKCIQVSQYAHLYFFVLSAQRTLLLVATSTPELGFSTILQLQVSGFLEELADSRAAAGNAQDKLGDCHSRKLESAQKNKISLPQQPDMDGDYQRGTEVNGQSWIKSPVL